MPDDGPQVPDDARPDEDAAAPAVDDGPTRFRVADTGWPPPAGPAGPALPRRTPGASGGPGTVGAPSEDVPQEPAPAAEPTAVRAGWVTSPPLDDQPWAGLPAPAEEAAAPEPLPAAAEPSSAPTEEVAPEPAVEQPAEAAPDQSAGRHRGPKARHGRPRQRGRRRRPPGDGDDAGGTAGSDAVASTDGPAGAADHQDIADAGDPTESDPGPSRRRSRASRARRGQAPRTWPAARLVLVVLALVAALVLGVLTIVTRVWPGPAGNPYATASTKDAIAAATAVAPPILSYDYTTIDKKAAQLAPLQTATCATQYRQLITTTVKPLAVQNKATQQATVLAAGVTSASKNAVTVLAFMQLTSSNSVKTGKEINEAQLSVSMVKQHGRWLLAGTSANGAGSGGTPSCGGASPTGK